jgi:hypothetical protein
MAEDTNEVMEQFKGLPMEALIGGPLNAAVKANVSLAQATAEFINTVGFKQIEGKNNTVTQGAARMVTFEFERPGGVLVDDNGKQTRTVEDVVIKVPLLSIVPVPNLQVDSVDIVFDMEVKSSTKEDESKDTAVAGEGEGKVGWGPFGLKVSIKGSVSSHKENTRTSDNSAKYHVEVHATNHGIPEGLARVLDIMATAAGPRAVSSAPVVNALTGEPDRDKDTGKITGLTPVNPDGSTPAKPATKSAAKPETKPAAKPETPPAG